MDPVMWLDPGVMTGWAAYAEARFSSGQADFSGIVGVLEEHCAWPSARVGWERFTITPHSYRMKGSETAMEVIGAIRVVALQHRCSVLSPASRDARRAAPARLLRALGWYLPGAVHANDAASHLVAWMIREGCLPDAQAAIIRARTLEGWNDD